MSTKIQILIILSLLLVLLVIVNMVRKRQLELKYVLVWMSGDIVLLVLACFPRLMQALASVLGIHSPMNMIFFLGFIFCLMLIFSLTVTVSRISEKVRRIAQVLAMLPEELKKELLEDDLLKDVIPKEKDKTQI